jgi:hypothetical protein
VRLARGRAWLAAWVSPLLLVAAGCGPQNAVVGAFPSPDASSQDAAGRSDERVLGWSTQFVAEEGLWQQSSPLPGATITFGVPSGAATDNALVELRLPGKPGAGPDTDPGPDVATQIATRRFLKFGIFRTRVSFASCAATEEVASAVFAFFNDGSDVNGNGIADNPEMDFQVLCGTPAFIVLTCWSDFEKATPTAAERFIKRSRAVDMSTGDIYDSVSDTGNAFAKASTDLDLVYPGFPDPNQFYEVGFDWQPSSVRFFIVNQGREMTLWTLANPNLIPQVPLQFMLNLWHPTEHWVPVRSPADYPAAEAVLRADWAEYWNP